MRTMTALIAAIALLLNAQMAQAAQSADEQAIISRTQAWIDVAAAGDIDGYLTFLTDDFIWLGSSRGAGITGSENIRAFLEPFFEEAIFSEPDWSTDEIVFSASGDQAIHLYTGVAVIEQKDGSGTSMQPRKYVDMWVREPDGVWRCFRHLFVRVE